MSPLNAVSVAMISIAAEAKCRIIEWASQRKTDNVDKVCEEKKKALCTTALLIQSPFIYFLPFGIS